MSESKSNEPVPSIESTQVPLKKRKLSENITATTETEETTKRPAKNLIELNLPTPDKSNIGKFQRDNQDHAMQQSEDETQEETVSALNRYENSQYVKANEGAQIKYTTSQTQEPVTEQSQIDPGFYQKILHQNILEEATLAESALQRYNHLLFLSEQDILNVQKKPKNSKNIKMFPNIVEEIEKAQTCQYFNAEAGAYQKAGGSTRLMIEKSSQHASAMIDPLMIKCKETITPKVVKFCNLDLTSIMPNGFVRDDKYTNCIAAPLKVLLDKNDRPRLVDCANMHIPRKLLASSKGRKRYYEVYKVFSNSDKNSTTKKIIETFFKHIFQDFDEHIEWMMDNPDIQIVLIVNRELVLTSGVLSNESIVGGILFNVHGIIGTSINAIGIHESYRYNSFGPFLIHLSQVMGAYEIDVRSDGAVTRHFQTYTACRGYLRGFYQSLGFSQVENMDDFKKGERYESFGTHLELDMWIDYVGEDKQVIMETSSLCYKMRNFVDPDNYVMEDCLYDYSMFNHKDAHFIPSKSWKASVQKSIREFQDSLEKQPLDICDLVMDKDNHFTPSQAYIHNQDALSLPFIGKMFDRAINIFEQKRRENRYQAIKASIPSLKHLKLHILQAHKAREHHNDEVWCHMTCLKCGKSCYIKNLSLDPIVIFIMKCIFSVWYQHVYTYLPDENNEWNKAFPDWHICEQRNGVDLERLKTATYHDQDKFRETKSLKPYYGFYKLFESFLVIYVESIKSIRESAAMYLCGVWCDRIKKLDRQVENSESTVTESKKGVDATSSSKSIKKRETVTGDSVQALKKRDQQEVENEDVSSHSSGKSEKEEKQKKVDYSRDEEKANPERNTNNNNASNSDIEVEEEWTDTDSEVGSDVSLDNYKTDNNSDNTLSDSRLRKVTNPQMVQKVQQYLSLRRELNDEGEQSSNRRKSYGIRTKKNKRKFKKLHSEIQTHMDCQDWYRQAKKDVKIQKSIHSIEYVDVSKRNSLPVASQNYINALAKMTKNEKTKMMEKETEFELKTKNHYVMYYGEKNKGMVVHPNWFTVEKDETVAHRVNTRTLKMCKDKPNIIQRLRKQEKNTIKKALDLDVDYHAIDRIERIKSTGQDTLIAYLDNSKEESIIKYKGYDRKSRTQYLNDAWLELNFKHLTTFWQQIKNLKVGQIVKVPTGSSNNTDKWEELKKEGTGPNIQYVQKNNDECLYYSLASAFDYMNYKGLAKLVISEFKVKLSSNGETDIGKLVGVLHNKKIKDLVISE